MTAGRGPSPSTDWTGFFGAGARERLASRLGEYARAQRWFRGKSRATESARVMDVIHLDDGGRDGAVVVLEVAYSSGPEERYLLPLVRVDAALGLVMPQALVAPLGPSNADAVGDGLATGQLARALLAAIRDGRAREGETGVLWGEAAPELAELPATDEMPVEIPRGEQSNSSVILADRLIMKVYRRLDPEPGPELEMGQFLTTRRDPPAIPHVLGALHYRDGAGLNHSAAILHELVPNEGDAWSRMLQALRTAVDRLSSRPDALNVDAELRTALAPSAAALGRRTAELHLALLDVAPNDGSHPAFTPVPLTAEDRAVAAERVDAMLQRAVALLPPHLDRSAEPLREAALRLLDPRASARRHITELLRRFRDEPLTVLKTRIHGDLHLGQILCRGDDFVITDFEGEPGRSSDERRAKASPLRDVVGMLRSFDYVVETVFRKPTRARREQPSVINAIKAAWARAIPGGFLDSYLARVADAPFLPLIPPAPGEPKSRIAPSQLSLMLRFYEVERLVYELTYELDNRPDWFDIPLRGLCEISAVDERASS